ncbi:pseudouridine synthase [Agrococcus sp. SL85]|uniref:pseudouridine synthase n=1 Tax=Agrococcus sp. SL85 TaxID=2995141 RepID=UPI003B63DCE9
MNIADPASEGERLQKVLAAAGVASRRVVEQMIVEGRIEVDGRIVTELGTRILPEARVRVDGTAVQLDTTKRYLMLNKPTGVVSTMADEQGRPDLRRFTDEIEERVYNVGRLDAETSGLLVLTNDGELAHVLAHPSFGVEKTYVAKVRGAVDQRTIRRLLDGVELEDGEIRADAARVVGRPSQGHSMVELTLHSGRNRIVRRMLDHVGHPVAELVRRSFGPLHLGTLRSGSMRELTTMERGALLTLARSAR